MSNKTNSLRARIPLVFPFFVFGILFLGSFRRWFLPFQDSGYNIRVAERLAGGQVLYRDVNSPWGPVWPYVDSLALKILGLHLDSLVILRTGLALLGVWLLTRLCLLIVDDRRIAASVTSLVVAACFFLPWGGSWPFPYSGSAVGGTVCLWASLLLGLGSRSTARSLLTGAVAGLAAASKVEFLPAAILAPLLTLSWKRGARDALGAASVTFLLAGAAWLGPIMLFGKERMSHQGILLAADLPGPFAHLYRRVFWGNLDGLAQLLSWKGISRYLPSAVLIGTAWAAVHALSRMEMTKPARYGGGAGLLLLGLLGIYVGNSGSIQVLIPMAGVFLTVELLACLRGRTWRNLPPSRAAALSVGVAMLPALARQPFLLHVHSPYSAFSAPLPLAFSALALARRTGGRSLFAVFLLGLSLSLTGERLMQYHMVPRRVVSFERGTLSLVEGEADLVEDLVSRLRRQTPPGSRVGAFPDGGLVLFLADRSSPFRYEMFHPGAQDDAGEREMIAALDAEPLAAAFVANRYFPEYGFDGESFGRDYLQRFDEEFQRRMEPAGIVGDPSLPRMRVQTATSARVYLPRRDFDER